jgi:hypothetical protein
MHTHCRWRTRAKVFAWLASALSILLVGSVFVGCQLVGRMVQSTRASYPTYASYEDEEIKVCISIIRRDRFRITIVNLSDSLVEIDWMNAYYHNNRGSQEPLMLLQPIGDGRMVTRLENTTLAGGATGEYFLYPDPVIEGGGPKGAPRTSHDERADRIPYPTVETSAVIPILIDSTTRALTASFESGVNREDMPAGCE